MSSLRDRFKRETDSSELSPGIDIFNVKYIRWLEDKLQNRESMAHDAVFADLKGSSRDKE